MSYQCRYNCVHCVRVCPTWSSRARSQKAGMYLAHSTRTRSCCFMDSHTSVMAAIFLVRMSPLIMGAGDEIWARQECVGEPLFTITVDECWVWLPEVLALPVSRGHQPGWVRWWMVNCCLRSWISWCWSCRVHFAQLKTDFWCLHKCNQLKNPKKQWEVSHLSSISFVIHTNLKMGEKKKVLWGLLSLSVHSYYCSEMFAQHKLVRGHSASGVNINKVLLSWVLQHTQTSRVNSVWRQHRHWFAECKRGF